MSWNKTRIDGVALASAADDYAMFEAIGLSEIEDACVLDMGCFDGFNTHLKFAPYENIARVVGVDPTQSALDEARSTFEDDRFSWESGDCETYGGPSESFDIVYFSHVFQHTRDKAASLENVFRLLKPGGYVLIKTIDDSCKSSYPDPNNAMKRLFSLYEQHILPNTPHTAHTDRNNGSKCYALLQQAGFTAISVKTTLADTAGKNLEQRRALFERCTYFRRNVPEGTDPAIAEEIHALLDEWGSLFEREDYYYSSPTFLVIAQKPDGDNPPKPYFGPLFGTHGANAAAVSATGSSKDDWRLFPMSEDDLGQVMAIELKSFPDPWTPVAYAMELRHNALGSYVVARNGAGKIGGYVGWWEANGAATIANIAVDPAIRRAGIGRTLLDYACDSARDRGCGVMQLQVRAANATARAFYAANGFSQMAMTHAYYANPDDDAIILARPLA